MTDQKVVLTTGASSGIGRATAELLTSRGYRVFGTARNLDTVVPVQGVELLSLEVRDDASVACGVETALSRAGRIDVLVNNAGYTVVGAIEETSPSEAQALFDTNVFGVLRMVRAVLPAMRRQGSGTIVNTSSVLGFLPGPFMGLYASSKHALEGLSESLDHEVRRRRSAPTRSMPARRSRPMQARRGRSRTRSPPRSKALSARRPSPRKSCARSSGPTGCVDRSASRRGS